MQALGCFLLLLLPFVILAAAFRVGYVVGCLCSRVPLLTVPAAVALWWVCGASTALWLAEQNARMVDGHTSAEGQFADTIGIWWWPFGSALAGWLAGLCTTWGAVAVPALLTALAVGAVGWRLADPATGATALALTLYVSLQGGRCRLWEGVLFLLALFRAPWLLPVILVAGRISTRVAAYLDRSAEPK